MTRRLAAIVVVLCAISLIAPRLVLAHEGHNHKVMGTVKSIQEKHLEVQDTTGKTSMVMITDQTKILRGKTAAALADIKVGERIVVIGTMEKAGTSAKAEQGGMMTAKEIHLAGASKTGTQ
jgi:predicted sulfurtransferase